MAPASTAAPQCSPGPSSQAQQDGCPSVRVVRHNVFPLLISALRIVHCSSFSELGVHAMLSILLSIVQSIVGDMGSLWQLLVLCVRRKFGFGAATSLSRALCLEFTSGVVYRVTLWKLAQMSQIDFSLHGNHFQLLHESRISRPRFYH